MKKSHYGTASGYVPKVSIVIPAYNEESYIEATLHAVLAQKYPDFEVIVVDNNSKDKTAEKVRAFPQVKLVEERTAGVQFARERGRQLAAGELIANLDADCVPLPDWLGRAVRYFDDPKVVAVTGPYQYYDVSFGARVSTFIGQNVFRNLLHKFFHAFFHRGGLIGGNAVMRAGALEKIGGYNTSIAFHGDDTDTGNRLGAQGKVLFKMALTIGSSGRRFKRFGGLKLTWEYMSNYFWVLFFNKPFNNDLERHRY